MSKYFTKLFFSCTILLVGATANAQDTGGGTTISDSLGISLQEAIIRGIDSSKELHLSDSRIRQAISQSQQVHDNLLPKIKAGYTLSQAFIPTQKIDIKGLTKDPIYLPGTARTNLGTVSVNQLIFAGNKMKYAEQSASLLEQIARLNSSNDQQGIILKVIESYINLFEIDQNLMTIAQNIKDVQGRLDETIKFRDQGLATQNDVLRFELEKAQVLMTQIDLLHNRSVANYAMNVLLGYPVNTILKTDSISNNEVSLPPLDNLVQEALQNRQDLATFKYQNQLADIDIKNVRADRVPTIGAGFSTYYVNPNNAFIPPANAFLFPITLGVNLSWNISNLYTNKHKLEEANIKRSQVDIRKSVLEDKISVDVNNSYHVYLDALQKIKVLQTAVEQARENDRIMELKYQNQLATTTDRIDAQTLLYQSLINLNLASADAVADYYRLLNTTGTLEQTIKK